MSEANDNADLALAMAARASVTREVVEAAFSDPDAVRLANAGADYELIVEAAIRGAAPHIASAAVSSMRAEIAEIEREHDKSLAIMEAALDQRDIARRGLESERAAVAEEIAVAIEQYGGPIYNRDGLAIAARIARSLAAIRDEYAPQEQDERTKR